MATNLSSDDRRELEALREDVAYLKQRVEALEAERPRDTEPAPASEATGDAEPK